MKKTKGKFRRALAGFLAFCVMATSFNMDAWAGVKSALESENATFVMAGESLRASAQEAIDTGVTFDPSDLGIGDEDKTLKKEYEQLFTESTVFEFMPPYEMSEEEAADGAELRMFVCVKDMHDGYQLTGDEEIIFLYINGSEQKITFRSSIDGNLTQKVNVKAYSDSAEMIPGELPEEPEETVNPDGGTIPSETEKSEEVTVPSETEKSEEVTVPSETEKSEDATAPSETDKSEEATAPSETEKSEDAAAPSETEKSGETAQPSENGSADEAGHSTESVKPENTDKPSGNASGEKKEDKKADKPEAGASDTSSKNTDTGSDKKDSNSSEDKSSDVQASVSRHIVPRLMTAAPAAVEPETEAAEKETAEEVKQKATEEATEAATTAAETKAEAEETTEVEPEVTEPAGETVTEPVEKESTVAVPETATDSEDSVIETEPSEIETTTETAETTENKETIKDKTYGAVLLDEAYYARAYVTTFNALTVTLPTGDFLTIAHHAFVDDVEQITVETVTDVKVGDEVSVNNYVWDKDNLEFARATSEDILTIAAGENRVDMYYSKIVPEREHKKNDVVISSGRKGRSAFSLEEDNTTPGKVFPTKTANWVDETSGIAKIDFTIYGNPIRQGSDVILVIDSSESMVKQGDGKRWTLAKAAAKDFIKNLYEEKDGVVSDNRIAIVDFDDQAYRYPEGSGESFLKVTDTAQPFSMSKPKPSMIAKDYFNDALENQMVASGETNYDIAFDMVTKVINARKEKNRPLYVVFMSDGAPGVRPKDTPGNSVFLDGQEQAKALSDIATIYSLGLELENEDYNKFIVPLASDSQHAKNITSSSQLGSIYDNIANEIKIAGTKAAITDVINTEDFEITEYNGKWYDTSTGTATKTDDDTTVTWNFGNISAKKETLTIYIRVKDTSTGGLKYTNKNADVTYQNPNDEKTMVKIPSPHLTIGKEGTITQNYYLVNEKGQPIAGLASESVVVFDKRYKLGDALYQEKAIALGTYNVTAPSTIEYEGNTYYYVADSATYGGTQSPASVNLNPLNKKADVYFGYKQVTDVTVTFDGNGGNVSKSTATVKRNTSLGNEIATAEKANSYFVEWNTKKDGTGSSFDGTTLVSENTTVYAQWKAKTPLTISATNVNVTYTGAVQTVEETNFKTSGLLDGHTLTGVKASGSGTNVEEGGYAITIEGTAKVLDRSGKDVTNQYAIKTDGAVLTIAPKAATIVVDNKSKAFDAKDPDFTGEVTGLIGAKDLGDVGYVRNNPKVEAVGVYPGVIVPKYVENPNYSVTVTNGNFEITTATIKGAAVTGIGGDWVYDGAAHPAGAKLEKAQGYTIYYKEAGSDWTTTAPSVTDVKDGIVTVEVEARREGYVTLTAKEPVTIQIKAKAVTIQVYNAEKFFDKPDPAKYDGKVTGLIKEGDLGEVKYVRLGTEQGVGTYKKDLSATFTKNENYSVTVNEGDFEIKAATDPDAELRLTGGSWPYDGKSHEVAINLTDVISAALQRYTIEYSVDGGKSWSGEKPDVTNVSEGTITVKARGTRTGYTTLESNEVTLAITPIDAKIVVKHEEKFFGKADPDFSGEPHGLVKKTDLDPIEYYRTNKDVEAVNIYTDVLDAKYKDNSNYIVTVEKADFTIKTATMEGASLEAKGGSWPYDGNSHAATTTLTGAPGYELYYKVGDGQWSTTAPSVTEVKDGTLIVSVEARKEGYMTLTVPSVEIKITAKPVSITVNGAWKFFDADDPAFIGSEPELVKAGDLGTISFVRENSNEAVGTYEEVLTAAYTPNPNYEVTIDKGDFEIKTATMEAASLEAKGGSWPYDGNSYAAAVTLTGAEGYVVYYKTEKGDWTTEAPTVTNVAEGIINVSVKAEKTGYKDLTADSVTIQITPKAVTIDVKNESKYFEESDPQFGGTPNGLVKSDDLGEITYVRTNNTEAVGVYTKVLTAKYTENPNYTVTVNDGDFEIKLASMPNANLSAGGGSWEYDGNVHKATSKLENADGYTVYYKVGDKEWSTTAPSVKDVADGKVTVSVKAIKNGFVELKVPDVTLQITAKKVVIVVENKSKDYGSDDPEFTGSVAELVAPGDLGTIVYHRAEADRDKNDVDDKIAITASYKDNANYDVTVRDGKLAIIPATSNAVNATGQVVTYDALAHGLKEATAVRPGSTMLYSEDNITFTETAPKFTEAGTYTVYVKAINPRYTETAVVEATVVINKRGLTITAGSASKKYDGAALTSNVTSITDGQLVDGHELKSVVVTGSQQQVGASANVVSDAVIMAGDKDVTANYEITYVNGTLTVTSSSSGGGGSTGDGGGSSIGGGDPTGPGRETDTIIINPTEVPLASLPPSPSNGALITIDDGEVPLAALPKTGDSSSAGEKLMLLFAGMMMAVYATVSSKKRKDD